MLDQVDSGDWVVGHADWRVEHLRFEDGRLTAVYDWDSVIIEREPVLVGAAAHGFTANFAAEEPSRQRPTLVESLAFVADYAVARSQPSSTQERQLAQPSLVHWMAYPARCEHSDAQLMVWGRRQAPPDSARAFVAAQRADLLDDARLRA